MPVYIRKGPLEIPPHEEKDWIKDDEGDYFLKDPDQFLDSLPQPFRMLNKLVNQLFDRAWEIIEEKEAVEAITIVKIKPPVFLPTEVLMLASIPNCFAISGNYVFVGLARGFTVFNVLNEYSRVCTWDTIKVEITSISATEIGNEVAVATVDEMGIVRLFFFYKEFLFLVKAINEVEDISKQTTCLDLKISPGGDFIAVLLQGAGDIWLDVYRLPKETWIKEIELPHSSSLSKKKISHLHIQKVVETPESSETENAPIKTDVKLSGPVQILRLRPPKPVTGSPFKNPLEVFQKIEDICGLGSGQNHMIKDSQMENQSAIFEMLFKKYLQVACPEENTSVAQFHFLLPGQILMLPSETRGPPDVACALGIHWSGNHNFFLYSLIRPPKEKEKEKDKEKDKFDIDLRPEGVWPTAAPIINSAITPCSSYLLLVCEDGVITLWDRAQGFLLAVISLPEGCTCKSLHFMENSEIYNKDFPFAEIIAASKIQVLVLCTDGSLHLMTANRSSEPSIRVVMERPVKHANEVICAVAPIPSFFLMALIFLWDGSMYLLDVNKSKIICELSPPSPYRLGNPWQPVFAVSSENQYVLIRGDKQDSESFHIDKYRIFVFDLTSCQLIQPSLSAVEFSSPGLPDIGNFIQQLPLEKRCEIFLQSRVASSDCIKNYGQDYLFKLRKSSLLVRKESRKK